MSLESQIKEVLSDFDNSSTEKIFNVLYEIIPKFKSNLTSEYLQEKIKKIQAINDEAEKKKQVKTLTPYFDWYLQGL
ncbi:MAG: hypothetical protein HKP31_05745 [Nitrosopumilus sp.]|nr:hypothetical protein [Nitrosopumilus sp.]